MASQLQHRLYHLLESGHAADRVARVFEAAMCTLIVLNVAAVAAETVPSLAARHGPAFHLFEAFSVTVFTVEYAARLWVCVLHPPLAALPPLAARLRFARTPFALVDLLAIAPFYLGFLVALDLRMLRVLRLVRLLKLARYSPALTTIGRVLYEERRALLGVLVIMGGLTVFAASLAYYAEHERQPDTFGSIPQAMWWALATLTTVGYGDAVPVTVAGKLTGALVMLFGLGLFALPIAIIATGFAQEVHRREFVVNWGMVARVPLFSHLSASQVIELARALSSQRLRPGAVIARPGDPANSLFMIVSGEVLVQPATSSDSFVLSDGDWFGEVALVARVERRALLTAVSETRLLELAAADFHRLMHADPGFRAHIEASLRERGGGRPAREPEAEPPAP